MAKDDILGLIPEIYYDLIARVAAGMPVVVIVASPTWKTIEGLGSVNVFFVFTGLGYVVGHVLATLSFLLNLIFWNPGAFCVAQKLMPLKYQFRSYWMLRVFRDAYKRIDRVSERDRAAGSILKKMEAGAAFTDNLLSGWLVILFYSKIGGHIDWSIDLGSTNNCLVISIVTAVLIVSLYMRRGIFIVREDGLLESLNYPGDRSAWKRRAM